MAESRSGVRCELTTRLAQPARERLQGHLRDLGLPTDAFAATHRLRLTMDAGRRRVDFRSKGPFGDDVSIVHTPEAAFWIQHVAKVFVALEPPRPNDAPPSPELGAERPRRRGRESARQNQSTQSPPVPERPNADATTMTDPVSGEAIRLTMRHEGEWRAPELTAPLLGAIFGGPGGELPPGLDVEHWTRVIVKKGFPSVIRVETLDPSGAGATLLSETTITEFVAGPVDDRDFTPPRGYRPWTMKSKEPREGRAGHTAVPPTPVGASSTNAGPNVGPSAGSSVGVNRQALDDVGGNEREPPQRPPPPPPPSTPPLTTTPRIGFRLEQKLLTQISNIFNTVVTPIRTVSITQGAVVFDWLTQLRDDVVRRGASAGGTSVLPLLHDITLPATPANPAPTPASDSGGFRCRGLIDQIVIRDAESRFRSGTYPSVILQGLTPATRARLTFAGSDWDLVQDSDKARLTFELLRREYAEVRIPFPTQTPPAVASIIEFRVSAISGGLTLPPVPTPAPRDPRFNPLLTLTAGFLGTVDGTLSIGTLGVTATVARWPGPTYWAILGAGIFAALIFPALAWVVPIMTSLTIFLVTDVVSAAITTTPLSASVNITFVQNAAGLFEPVATCTISGVAMFRWASFVPTGIHQILAAMQQAIVNALSGTMLRALADGIAGAITGAARQALGAGFPASALKLGLPIAGGTKGGQPGRFTYLEARLDLSRDARYQLTSIATPASLQGAQDTDIKRVVPGTTFDHYGSLSMDQNFANAALVGMRLQGMFDSYFSPGAMANLKALMPPPLPKAATTSLQLVAEEGPSIVLDTQQASGINNHGRISAGYALNFRKAGGTPIATLRFRVDTTGQLVLGSAVRPGEDTALVRIQTVPDRAFDFLIDSAGATVTAVSLDLVTITEVRTSSIEYDDRGKPHKVVEVDFVETLTSVPISGTTGAAFAPLLQAVFGATVGIRRSNRAPRQDGIPGGAVDPVTTLRYPLGEQDPDELGVLVPFVRAEIGLERGLGHFHLGLAGPLGIAFLPARTGSVVPTLAALAGTFAAGILSVVKVRASSTGGRSLSL